MPHLTPLDATSDKTTLQKWREKRTKTDFQQLFLSWNARTSRQEIVKEIGRYFPFLESLNGVDGNIVVVLYMCQFVFYSFCFASVCHFNSIFCCIFAEK